MTSFVHDQPVRRVVFGAGALNRLDAEVAVLGATRLLLVATRSAAADARRCRELLGGRIAAEIGTVRPHVPAEDVAAARTVARGSHVDGVLAIGGGSAIGLAKAVVLETETPIVAVPTTYSGSELTPVYGITEEGRKRTGRSAAVAPRLVLYDPLLTTGLPKAVTASTGMNALAHCVEALYAHEADPAMQVLAQEGARLLHRDLPRCVSAPGDPTIRARLLLGAYYAGLALASCGMALHHRICHVLGGSFGLSHGDVNAVLLPHVIRYNASAARPAIERLADAFGASDPAGSAFDLAKQIGAPVSLAELGMERGQLRRASELVCETPQPNPRAVQPDGVLAILEDAYAGRRPSLTRQEEPT